MRETALLYERNGTSLGEKRHFSGREASLPGKLWSRPGPVFVQRLAFRTGFFPDFVCQFGK